VPDFGDTARKVWMPETAAIVTSDACDSIRHPELSAQIQIFTFQEITPALSLETGQDSRHRDGLR
jgi:hypothetical protein